MPENPSDKQLPSDLFGEKESAPGLDIGYYFHLLKRYLWLFLAIVVLAVADLAVLGAPAAEDSM